MKDPETQAIDQLSEILSKLEPAAVSRVLRWAMDRFALSKSADRARVSGTGEFEDLPSFYAAVNPHDDDNRVLAVAYWLQVREGLKEIPSQAINKRLKDLGYGIQDITKPLGNLTSQTPSLIVRLRKGGTSRQARKAYKVTNAGVRHVESASENRGEADAQ